MAVARYVPKQPVYRRGEHRYLLPLLYVACPIALFATFAWFVSPWFALGCVPWAWLAWRTYRIGIFVSADGVVVRNVLRSHSIRWDEISSFGWGGWWGFAIGGVYLKNGRFVRAFALNPPFELKPGIDPAVPRALEGLNEELERVRAAPPI